MTNQDAEIERLRAALRQAEDIFRSIASTKPKQVHVHPAPVFVLYSSVIQPLATTGEQLCRDTLLPVKK